MQNFVKEDKNKRLPSVLEVEVPPNLSLMHEV